MTENEKLKVGELLALGHSQRAVSKLTGVPKSTVGDYAKKLSGASESVTEASTNPAKILLLDCESAPSLIYAWGRFKQNIGQNQIVREGYILTWSAKWLGDDNIAHDSLHFYPHNMVNKDDQPLIASIYDMMNEADIVIAHNGDKFDMPLLKARMVYHGFPPPAPFKTVDTLKIAKKEFRFPSNKLDSLCQYLGIGEKIDTGGFELWARCMDNDIAAFEEMLEYNIYDVVLLEGLYQRIAPWYSTHVNVTNFGSNEEKQCTVCGSNDLEEKGVTHTNLSTFTAYQCNCCGKWSRDRVNMKTKEQMQNTLMNIGG